MIHNHWGILCDTEKPVTCVYGGNELNWEYLPEMLDPTDYSAVPEGDQEFYEPTNWLIGDWALGEDGLWDIIKDLLKGEKEFIQAIILHILGIKL